jgi:hypothetical protein
VNASYNVVGEGLEEILEMQDASAQSSFQFLLKTPIGTTASQQDGSWAFALPGRAPASFWLQAPFAYDSGAKNIDPTQSHAQISVKEVSGGFQVTLGVDAAWLHDPARVFPVFVDPTLTIQPDTLDTTFAANCATCSGFVDTSGRMFIGTNSTCGRGLSGVVRFRCSRQGGGRQRQQHRPRPLRGGRDPGSWSGWSCSTCR